MQHQRLDDLCDFGGDLLKQSLSEDRHCAIKDERGSDDTHKSKKEKGRDIS
jgi:hypothetical protein